jgi:hypothetical protein
MEIQVFYYVINPEAFAATEFNYIYPGQTAASMCQSSPTFQGLTPFPSSTLQMGPASVPETLKNFETLAQLSAREGFIEFYFMPPLPLLCA